MWASEVWRASAIVGDRPPYPVLYPVLFKVDEHDHGVGGEFASLRVEKRDLFFGEMSDSHRYVLQRFNWMKSAQLFSVGPGSPEYNESGDHRSVFYSQSWLVVHYLMDKRRLAEASKFLDLVQDDHMAIPAALQIAFGMATERFDKELDGYYRGAGNMKYYRQVAPPGLAEGAYASTSISLLDAQALLADLDIHSRDHRDRAIGEYEAVLQKDPNNALANRGLGYAKLMHGNPAEARPLLEKAVASDANDALAHYYYALLLSRNTVGVTDYGDAKTEVSQANGGAGTMKAQAQAAIAIDSQFADAYELLGRAESMEGDRAGALVSLRKAIQLNPHNDAYRMNLASYFLNTHEWDAAKQVFTSVANRPNSFLAAAARTQLENLDHMRKAEASGPPRIDVDHITLANPDATAVNLSPTAPVHFAKGKLMRVDCSAGSGAKLLVQIGEKEWTFSAPDRKRLVLLGEDDFSCEWRDRNVAVNYRDLGEGQGDVVSLEFQ
jgi:tetratricopeptide (TPR) repeat protein